MSETTLSPNQAPTATQNVAANTATTVAANATVNATANQGPKETPATTVANAVANATVNQGPKEAPATVPNKEATEIYEDIDKFLQDGFDIFTDDTYDRYSLYSYKFKEVTLVI